MCVPVSRLDCDNNPQTLLFSATTPPWVYEVAKKYMRTNCKHIDLIGKKTQKAATTVEVSAFAWEGVCTGWDGCNLMSIAAVLLLWFTLLRDACMQGQLK